jgi:hypothetical protein
MKVFISKSIPDTYFPLQELMISVELHYLMTEMAQNTSQIHFMTQLDSFPPE